MFVPKTTTQTSQCVLTKSLTGIKFQRNNGGEDIITERYRYEVDRKEELETSKMLGRGDM